MLSGGFRFALPTLRSAMTKEKGSGTPTDVFSQPPHLAMRRASKRDALAYRRSTTALTVRAFGPWAQLQARLPGTWQDVRSGTVAPTGERRPRVLTRALPAPACPSPGNAPPGPVVVPVSMMPKAARHQEQNDERYRKLLHFNMTYYVAAPQQLIRADYR